MKPLNEPSSQLSKIVLNGYKSIKHCELELGAINILIGCNGAGKSNFIGFFNLIAQLLNKKLQLHVGKQGGPDALLHFGRKITKELSTELYFGNNGYKFTLEPTIDNRMMFTYESLWWNVQGDWDPKSGHFESQADRTRGGIKRFVLPTLENWRVFHFHDTGNNSPLKKQHPINDNAYLRPDGENLAAFLYLLQKKHNKHYQRIVKVIRSVAPFFGDFNLRPALHNSEMIELEWEEKNSDIPFKAHHFSDGTLRFVALATVLLQPDDYQPETILIDEPELGLHPFAIKFLAGLIKSTSKTKQLIVSTQSVELLDEFDADDIVVANRENNQSVLKRLDDQELTEWLSDYGLGELWKKNILGGRPSI